MFIPITVAEYERGLEYRAGRFQRVLEPGRYRVWAFSGRTITKLDVREQALQITGQDVLTADRISVRLNILVRFRVSDPAKVMHEVVSYHDALHQAAQLAARELVATRELESFLTERMQLSAPLIEATAERARQFGVEVVDVAVKDAVLAADLKEAYEAKLRADLRGQTALIEARHQVAAARAQANAAKVLQDNPAILAQRQLEILASAAQQGYGNHFVVLPESLGELARKLASSQTD